MKREKRNRGEFQQPFNATNYFKAKKPPFILTTSVNQSVVIKSHEIVIREVLQGPRFTREHLQRRKDE